MEQGEQDAHQHRQHVAQLHVVIDQLRHQQAAEQCAAKEALKLLGVIKEK